ncbi:hypothetical protein PPACK8108_LOCUS8375 [Phakopsora pachyrhizi]|uniref:Uncharacterized protein n=1 Tax=Phakopsora pachyrhizi TaxID=170000 RepID=A0AAV0AWC9_PHAPC|nr:hypothetical protein PPACK8108_LOCUS8375 [Phakopsora pachyrhizi]
MTPPSVRLIISFFLVFTVGSRISFRNLFPGTFPTSSYIEPYTWTPPTFSFLGVFLLILLAWVKGSLKS